MQENASIDFKLIDNNKDIPKQIEIFLNKLKDGGFYGYGKIEQKIEISSKQPNHTCAF